MATAWAAAWARNNAELFALARQQQQQLWPPDRSTPNDAWKQASCVPSLGVDRPFQQHFVSWPSKQPFLKRSDSALTHACRWFLNVWAAG